MAEENTSTKRRNTRRKRTSTKQQSKSQSFSLRSEVKGLIVIAFAVISFLGFFGFELGLVGQILTGIFRYGFGLGGIIPCLCVFWLGWRLLYKDTFISITKRGVVMTLFFLFLLALVPLWRVPEGQELITTQLANQGGFVGGAIATFLRTLLGNLGAIILDVFLLIAFGLLVTRLSLRSGLQKAADKTQVGLDVANEVAAEQVAVAAVAAAEKTDQTDCLTVAAASHSAGTAIADRWSRPARHACHRCKQSCRRSPRPYLQYLLAEQDSAALASG